MRKIKREKHIALIAHDGKKDEILAWCEKNREILKNYTLYGTGTTAKLIEKHTGLNVIGYNSGPIGGDIEVGQKVVDGTIDMIIFLSDPLDSQPHDPDIKALLRIATLYNVPMASNTSTAEFLITSPLMNEEVEFETDSIDGYYEKRKKILKD